MRASRKCNHAPPVVSDLFSLDSFWLDFPENGLNISSLQLFCLFGIAVCGLTSVFCGKRLLRVGTIWEPKATLKDTSSKPKRVSGLGGVLQHCLSPQLLLVIRRPLRRPEV